MQTDIRVVKATVMTMIRGWDLGMSMGTIIQLVQEIVEDDDALITPRRIMMEMVSFIARIVMMMIL